MPDPIMYSEDMFVFLTPDAVETFLTPPELIDKLKEILQAHGQTNGHELPPELKKQPTEEARAQYLLETHCEFETAPGESVQWYAVRLEK